MVTIQGTDRIKSVLDLSSIKHQLVKGQTLHLRDEDFWKPDIQTALTMGWIVTKTSPSSPEAVQTQVSGNRYIKCINNHHRSISMRENDREIRPGQVFTLKESEMDSGAIRAAVSKGIIKPLGVADADQETDTEGRVHVTKRMQEIEDIALPSVELDTAEQNGEGTVKLDLETNEEVVSSSVVVEDTKGVVWNKTSIDTPSDVIQDENPPSVDPNVGDPRRNSIVVDPNKARLNAYVANKEVNITFVDQAEKQQRIDSHPKLKNKPVPEDEGVVVISDLDDNEARIAAHPILSKQPRQNGVDFIDDLDTVERIEKHPVLSKQKLLKE